MQCSDSICPSFKKVPILFKHSIKLKLTHQYITTQSILVLYKQYTIRRLVTLGSLVVIVVAIGPKVLDFKPGRGRWIYKGDKN
jgi:hypothetical protein